MAKVAAGGTRALALVSAILAGILLIFGQVRLSALALALTFLAIAAARAQGVLPVTFWIRRARTDILMALILAVALATLALALPLGR